MNKNSRVLRSMSRVDIFAATHEGNLDGVRRELAAGVDPNVFVKGQSVLMIACERGHASICELLLRNGAKINGTDRYGRTALYQAVVFNQPHCTKVLMEHGARHDTRSWLGGESPLEIAKLRSNVELQRALASAPVGTPTRLTMAASAPCQPAAASAVSAENLLQSKAAPVETPLALSFPRRAPAPEIDESHRPEALVTGANNIV